MHVTLDYERLYRDVLPSVVSIYVGRRAPAIGAGSGFVYDVMPPDESAERFDEVGSRDATDSLSSDGYIVTNQHVVGDESDVEVRFSDGQWRTGRVVGRDAYTDLAVVRVESLPRVATPLAVARENPTPGRPVAALGNPLGLDGSITAGIVSGSNRSMHTSSGFSIPDVVQTDAPINPGNSGGPLVALAPDASVDEPRYEVVGVNRARQGDNIGFAISPTIVTRVVPSLIEEGHYRHSYLRTRTLDVTPAVADANDLDDPRGVLVVDVATGPTAGDRLRRSTETRTVRGQRIPVGGDVIVGINGHELRSHEELMRYLIAETRPHEPVEIDVIRDGEPRTLNVVLGERPDPDERIPVS